MFPSANWGQVIAVPSHWRSQWINARIGPACSICSINVSFYCELLWHVLFCLWNRSLECNGIIRATYQNHRFSDSPRCWSRIFLRTQVSEILFKVFTIKVTAWNVRTLNSELIIQFRIMSIQILLSRSFFCCGTLENPVLRLVMTMYLCCYNQRKNNGTPSVPEHCQLVAI